MAGFEPATSSLPRKCSTPELHRQSIWSGRRGSNSRPLAWKANALPTELLPHLPACRVWAKMDSNHRRYKPADLQSAPFGHSGIRPCRHIPRAGLRALRDAAAAGCTDVSSAGLTLSDAAGSRMRLQSKCIFSESPNICHYPRDLSSDVGMHQGASASRLRIFILFEVLADAPGCIPTSRAVPI